jgi:peptide/nickel transport system substrate-binding protein
MLSGAVNLAKVTGQDRGRLEAQGMKRLDWQTTGAWLSFNQIGGRPTADLRVRKALVSALNLAEVVKVSTGGTRQAATGLLTIAPTACAANTVAGQLPGYDVKAAQQLLDQAGWVRGSNGLRARNGKTLTVSLEYLPTNSAYDAATAELLAQQWKKIGVDVKLSGDPFAKLNEVLFKTSDWDVYLGGWFFSLPSQLVRHLSGPTPPTGSNIAGIDNERYNRLAAQAKTLTAPPACEYWNDAERAIIGDLDLVPVSNRVEYWFTNKAQAAMQRYNGPIPASLRLLK